MAEEPKTKIPPEEAFWGISYLREDIQDLKLDLKEIRDKIDRVKIHFDNLQVEVSKQSDKDQTKLYNSENEVGDKQLKSISDGVIEYRQELTIYMAL